MTISERISVLDGLAGLQHTSDCRPRLFALLAHWFDPTRELRSNDLFSKAFACRDAVKPVLDSWCRAPHAGQLEIS